MKHDEAIDIAFIGDTYFGEWHMDRRRRLGEPDILAERGYLGFASNLNPLLNACDLVVANLECVLTDRDAPPFSIEKIHVYGAKQKPTVEALKASNVGAVTLANNHAGDYGKAGIIDTLEALEKAGIRAVGAGCNEIDAAKPLFFADNKISEFRIALVSTYNLNPKNQEYGFYAEGDDPGINMMRIDRQITQAKVLKAENPNLYLVYAPHWGDNYIWRPRFNRQRAKKLTSAPFDLIIGHSAHMMQEIEYINNTLVLYSIGNFILNGDGKEYREQNLPPFSFVVRLRIKRCADTIERTLRIYPFNCDNSATDYRPRFVTEEEFEHVRMILRSHRYRASNFDRQTIAGCDDFGHYLLYKV